MTGSTVSAVAVIVLLVASDLWVYSDARRRSQADDDVVASLGPLTLSTPEQWLLATLLVWIVFLPMYLVARRY